MNISVVLCTYNRGEALARALQSVSNQVLPPSIEWEVLVVNNNSTDQTSAVVEGYTQRFPGRFRYVFEPRPGKSHALNAGIQAARGDILAFMDDDVTMEPNWLQNLTAELHSSEWAGAGGPILPERAFSLPRWLSVDDPRSLAPLALFNPGSEPGILRESPFGTNMAFRKEIFDRFGGFRTDLGPQPDSLLRGEDSEFGKRVMAAGLQIRYEPSARVFHAALEERLQKHYFLGWWFDKGRSDLREFGIPPEASWSISGIPLFMLRNLTVWTLRWVFAIRPCRRFFWKIQIRWMIGQIVESRQKYQSLALASTKVRT